MVKLVGILNITPDSFSDGGLYNSTQMAILKAEELIKDGANIIDIGAESTRPTAIPITHNEEWNRLRYVVPYIVEIAHKNNVEVSIDSRYSLTIRKLLDSGSNIDIINDVSGLKSINMIKLAAESAKKVIFMHNLGVPASKTKIMPIKSDIVKRINSWALKRMETFLENDIKKENLIFDPGIGFGKNKRQSWDIINNIDNFNDLGIPLMIGHSRKSFLGAKKQDINLQDEKTLEVSKYLLERNIKYLRVHNVQLHNSFLEFGKDDALQNVLHG
jgi:dihydropteroate synthase